jgi:hypothetical protein
MWWNNYLALNYLVKRFLQWFKMIKYPYYLYIFLFFPLLSISFLHFLFSSVRSTSRSRPCSLPPCPPSRSRAAPRSGVGVSLAEEKQREDTEVKRREEAECASRRSA